MNNKVLLTCFLALFSYASYGQVDLINKVKGNQSENAKEGFQWTDVHDIERTEVKNQGASGTCWSYSSNSFLESEMVRNGKKPVDIAEMYTVRNTYREKADRYVRMHGNLNFGQGGALPDVTDMLKKYGAVPQSAYAGLNYGEDINRHGELDGILQGMLDAVIANKNKKLSPVWKDAFDAVLDVYLGAAPESFEFEGKTYTPKSFADDYMELDADNYVQITSWTHQPMYKPFAIMVPDNWNYGMSYNVQMDEMIKIIDNALKEGYSISWAGDVSEKSFSWRNGIAYVPEKDYRDMSKEERENMFNGPQPEMTITVEARQMGYDNYTTTDDHGMQLVGMSKDQNGKEWYLVKNSWGNKNDYEGYLYMSKNYVRLKTMSFLMNKNAIPKDMRKKLNL